jgi:hypothetical protein
MYGPHQFDRFFDEENPNWSSDSTRNLMFIQSTEAHLNSVLRKDGFVTMNDVFSMLGFERTERGALAGWFGDASIDFGLVSDLGEPISLTFNINSTNVFRDK